MPYVKRSGYSYKVRVPPESPNGTAQVSCPTPSEIASSDRPRVSIPIVTMTNSVASFVWSTYPGKTYRVLYKNDFKATSWTTQGADSVAAGYARFHSDTNAPSQQRFYRVMQVN